MDACTAWIIVMVIIIFGLPLIIFGYGSYAQGKRIEQAKRDYVDSVRATTGNPDNNMELMQQMRPSDKVVSYIELKYNIPGRKDVGFIAVTEERLIFKAVAVGDHTASLNNAFANNRGASSGLNLRFDFKEETCNIPVNKVTSMSKATESFEITGCMKSQTETLSAFVLRINAQGLQYNLFLGKNGSIADEFVRTFTSMTYDLNE